MADQLATPEDLAALLQQDLDRSTAELLIQCATAVVQNAARGQRILQVVDDVVTLYLDALDGGTWLSLPQRPVTAVSAVSIGLTTIADFTTQLSRGRLYRPDGWRSTLIGYADQPSTVTVTYTHGYPSGHQKLQLARSAVLSLAAGGYTNPTGAAREQIDDYAVQYASMSASMEAAPQVTASLRRAYAAPLLSGRLVRT